MAWILAALAAFNVSSMLVLHKNRLAPRMEIPWTRFGYSLLTSELAWIWLPVQVLAALVLVASGALSSSLGVFSGLALLASWGFMARSIRQALQATDLTESALREELGSDYRASIPETIRNTLEQEVGFEAWRHPFAMPRPGVERIANIPYGPRYRLLSSRAHPALALQPVVPATSMCPTIHFCVTTCNGPYRRGS